jgi:hypothetical protein
METNDLRHRLAEAHGIILTSDELNTVIDMYCQINNSLKQNNPLNNDVLRWLKDNYIEDEDECIELLFEHEKSFCYSIPQIIEACQIIRIVEKHKTSLSTHLNFLSNYSLVGINHITAGLSIAIAVQSVNINTHTS